MGLRLYIKWGDFFARRGGVLVPPPKKGSNTMRAKASLIRTLVVLPVVLVAVALFGLPRGQGEVSQSWSVS